MVCYTASSQRQTHTIKIEIKPENGRGFYGTLDFVYAFENCFGEAHMLYTYKNVNIRTFVYEGRSFTASELDLQSFDKYLISPEIIIDIKKPTLFFKNGQARDEGIDGGISYNVKKGIRLKNVLDTQLAGCYGQTYKVGNYKKAEISNFKLEDKNHLDIKYLYANGIVAYCNWEAILNEKAKCIINKEDCEKSLTLNEVGDKYIVRITNIYSFRDIRYTNSRPYGKSTSIIYAFDCNPTKNIKNLKKHAKKLFSSIRSVKVEAPLVIGASKSRYYFIDFNFNGNIDKVDIFSKSENPIEYSNFQKLIDNNNSGNDIEKEFGKNHFSYLKSLPESGILYNQYGVFFVPNEVLNLCNISYSNETTKSKEKSYWKN